MVNREINNKEVLQCRSCKNTFHQSDVKEVKTERCGLVISEKVCPECGSHTYGYIKYSVDEFDLLYKNYYHRNIDMKLRKKLFQITEEIFNDDTKEYKQKIKNKRFVQEVNNERRVATA